MYEKEFEFLQDHIDLVENHKFDELFKLEQQTSEIRWENVLKICYDPDIDINPLEGLVEIPWGFLSRVNLPDLDLVIPANVKKIDDIAFSAFNSIKFENPDCEILSIRGCTINQLRLPEHIKLDNSSNTSLTELNAKIILPKSVDYIGKGHLIGTSPNLVLVWTADGPVRMDPVYTPKNKKNNTWHVTKTNLKIRR